MPGLNPTQEDLEQFVAITQASHEDAEHFLSSGTTLQGAIEDFYAAQTAGAAPVEEEFFDVEDESASDEAIMSQPNEEEQISPQGQAPRAGGITLGGEPVDTALPAGWGKPERKSGRVGEWTAGQGNAWPGGIATLFNTGVAGPSNLPPGDESDDDDNEEVKRRRGETTYAGGERSGLAIQNPGQPGAGAPEGARGLVDNILRQAANNGPNPARSAPAPSRNPFGGLGNTLGTDETPSSAIPDPTALPGAPSARPPAQGGYLTSLLGALGGQSAPPPEDEEDVQTRHLIFWRDGFSIEDGPLMRYDAPGNKELLETIQAGRAPPHLFNVRYNQALQLEVAQRTTEEYRPPPKQPAKPFEGSGNRLGSPAPEIAGSGSSTPSMPGGMRPQGILHGGPSSAQGQSAGGQTKFEVDENKPTTSVQLRLGDGTRMVARVNLTHTVGDLRGYVSAARPDARSFVLQTTFPSRELGDSSETVEAAKLQNAVVVQRYT